MTGKNLQSSRSMGMNGRRTMQSGMFAASLLLPIAGASAAPYKITALLPLGSDFQSDATAINTAGNAVGSSLNIGGTLHATYYSGVNPQSTTAAASVAASNSPSFAQGINSLGRVVGSASGKAFYANAGSYNTITPLAPNAAFPGPSSTAYGINDGGVIVGAADPGNGDLRAFYTNVSGALQPVDGPGAGFSSVALAVNNFGKVVGNDLNFADGQPHAFVFDSTVAGSTPQELPTANGDSSTANAINDNGVIVGQTNTDTNSLQQAAIYSNGTVSLLGVLPGGTTSDALGINLSGTVVGSADNSNGDSVAFIYNGGSLVDLNTLLPAGSSWNLTTAEAINNSGQIVGQGIFTDAQSVEHTYGFLLTPVPEPTTAALLAIGGASLLIKRRRK